MFLFPLIYITAFFLSIRYLINNKIQGILLFFVFGLPIYTISLSVTFMYGFRQYIPILQSFKEIIVITALIYLVLNLKKKLPQNSPVENFIYLMMNKVTFSFVVPPLLHLREKYKIKTSQICEVFILYYLMLCPVFIT